MRRNAKKAIEIREGAGGETAYVSGTRVRVSDVVRLFQVTQEQIVIERMRQSLPTLTERQLTDALAYWREHPERIQAEIDEEEQVIASLPEAG